MIIEENTSSAYLTLIFVLSNCRFQSWFMSILELDGNMTQNEAIVKQRFSTSSSIPVLQ